MIFEVIISYLIGSIHFSYLIGRLIGIDISKHWDENLGATNLYFALKEKREKYAMFYFILAGFLDILKGIIPALLFDPISSAFAIVGHCFSIFSYILTKKLPTGCGIATSIGWHMVYTPSIFLIAIPLGFLYFTYFKILFKKVREEVGILIIHFYSVLLFIYLFIPQRDVIFGTIIILTAISLVRIKRYRELLYKYQ